MEGKDNVRVTPWCQQSLGPRSGEGPRPDEVRFDDMGIGEVLNYTYSSPKYAEDRAAPIPTALRAVAIRGIGIVRVEPGRA